MDPLLRPALQQIEAVVSHTPQFIPETSQRHFVILASDYSITVEIAYPDDPLPGLSCPC